MPLPSVLMTSPRHPLIGLKPHLSILATLPLKPWRSPLLIAYHTKRLWPVAAPLVLLKMVKSLVQKPDVADSPVLLNCSVAGRLNIRSASISVLVGLWLKTSSLLGWDDKYVYSNSESNSASTVVLSLSLAVKMTLKGTSSFFCLTRFSGRPSGPSTLAWG